MPHDSIPRRDAELEVWAHNVDARVNSDPARFGLSPFETAEFHLAAESYAAALAPLQDPDTRTRPNVSAKNAARDVLRTRARQVVRRVNAHVGLTEADRAQLGLAARSTGGAAIPPPSTKPLFTLSPDGWVRLRDETLTDRRGKPPAVWGAAVFLHIGDAPPASPDDARLALLATRGRFKIPLPAGADGRTMWVLIQWVGDRGQRGPASAVVRRTIAV